VIFLEELAELLLLALAKRVLSRFYDISSESSATALQLAK